MSEVRILVKVGKKTELNMMNCDCDMAITVHNMDELIRRKEYSAIIIDGNFGQEENELSEYMKELSDELRAITVVNVSNVSHEVANTAEEYTFKCVRDTNAVYVEVKRITGEDISTLINSVEIEDIKSEEDVEHDDFNDGREEVNKKLEKQNNTQKETSDTVVEGISDVDNTSSLNSFEAHKLEKELSEAKDALRVLSEENDELCKLYKNLLSNDKVLENPISESEYEEQLKKSHKFEEEVDELNNRVEQFITRNGELSDQLNEKKEENTRLKESLSKVQEEARKLRVKVEELSQEVKVNGTDELAEARFKAEAHVRNELLFMLTNSLDKTGALKKNVHEAKIEAEKARREANRVLSDNSILQATVDELKSLGTGGVEKEVYEDLQKSYDSLLETNDSLRVSISTMELREKQADERVKQYKERYETLDKTNRKLKENVSELTAKIEKLGSSNESGKVQMKPIEYLEKAKIITVSSNTSCGVTTTAVSLAHRLMELGDVLVMDFNTANPKLDAWFGKSPIAKGVPSASKLGTNGTGMGLLMYNKVREIEQYFTSTCLKTTMSCRGGSVSFFGGMYNSFSHDMLLKADYESLFRFLGRQFRTIIIDCGIIGVSEDFDKVYGEIAKIASANIVVTTDEQFDIRNLKLKLSGLGMINNRTRVVVNMRRKALEKGVKEQISQMEYVEVPFETDIFGERLDFYKSRLTAQKFDPIVKGL